MNNETIGIIGFGEVGAVFSRAMKEAGADIIVYDALLDQPDRSGQIESKILDIGIRSGSLEDVVKQSKYVLSTVITQVARDVARQCVSLLNPDQIYIDLNSTSPSVKVEVDEIIAPSGAGFVEGAILGAIGATGSKTRILTAGKRGQEAADILNRFGLNVTCYSPEIGKASMFKMLRSIFSKGVEILLLEMMVAGKRAGIEKDLWKDITHFMASKPFDKIGSNWMQSHAVAYERRYYEMVQVLETMEEIGVQPIMTEGTAAFFKQSMDQNMGKAFPEKPESIDEIITFINQRLQD